MTAASPQLFVYGSLRSGFNHPAFAYISNHFHLIGPARVQGQLYDLGDYPAAVPSDTGDFIMGELYALNEEQDFSWVIAQVDDYEGVNPDPGEVPQYRREMTTVYLDNGMTGAWVYWYNHDVTGKPLIASGDVLQYLQQKKQ